VQTTKKHLAIANRPFVNSCSQVMHNCTRSCILQGLW